MAKKKHMQPYRPEELKLKRFNKYKKWELGRVTGQYDDNDTKLQAMGSQLDDDCSHLSKVSDRDMIEAQGRILNHVLGLLEDVYVAVSAYELSHSEVVGAKINRIAEEEAWKDVAKDDNDEEQKRIRREERAKRKLESKE